MFFLFCRLIDPERLHVIWGFSKVSLRGFIAMYESAYNSYYTTSHFFEIIQRIHFYNNFYEIRYTLFLGLRYFWSTCCNSLFS